MLFEMQRFVAFADGFNKATADTIRGYLEFEPMLVETNYVTWVRRVDYGYSLEFCEVHFADRGQTFVFDMSYEAMRDLLRECEKKR
jgi:hypothetical protein